MLSKEELKKTFNIFVDQENNIISIIFCKEAEEIEDNIVQTELVEEQFMKILNNNKDKQYRVIVDIFDLGKGAGDISAHQTREVYKRMAAQDQVIKIGVVLGGNPVLEVMANLLIKAIGKKKGIHVV